MTQTFRTEPEIPSGAPAYSPSATVEDFIYAVAGGPRDEFRLLLLCSSRGEGKTTGGLIACLALADRIRREGYGHLLPVRIAVVRDTWVNIHRTTQASFEKAARLGVTMQWRDQQRECLVPGACHFYFFGLDSRDDVDKLQGFECGVLWLEEVAPGAELSQGIPAETLGIGRTSIRQEGIPKRILVTYNPSDEDHWILKVEEHLAMAGLKGLVVHRFWIPPGEKSAQFRKLAKEAARRGDFQAAQRWQESADEFDQYREQNIAFLESIGRHDLVARLGRGEIGGVQMGEAVVSSFSYKLHVTEPGEILLPLPGTQLWRSWDSGGYCACVFLGETPAGNVDVYGSRTGVNKAMASFILDDVLPFMKTKRLEGVQRTEPFGRGQRRGWVYRDTGDPALWNPDYISNAERSAGQVVQDMLHTSFEAGPVEWSARREAGNLAFQRKGTGKSGRMLVRIQREECKLLVQALGGRAHFPIDLASGRINFKVTAMKRASGIFSHELDALLYFFALRFPAHEWLKRPPGPNSPKPAVPEPRGWLDA